MTGDGVRTARTMLDRLEAVIAARDLSTLSALCTDLLRFDPASRPTDPADFSASIWKGH